MTASERNALTQTPYLSEIIWELYETDNVTPAQTLTRLLELEQDGEITIGIECMETVVFLAPIVTFK
jgi:hypothetical protein